MFIHNVVNLLLSHFLFTFLLDYAHLLKLGVCVISFFQILAEGPMTFSVIGLVAHRGVKQQQKKTLKRKVFLILEGITFFLM